MLPVTVIVPALNSMKLLPRHLDALQKWSNTVQEIVFVDSNSTDGTLEYAKARLQGSHVRFYTHPPGLYQSWNFGICEAGADYIYLSTVGDVISGEGLAHLVQTAARLQSDVVLSPPQFVDEQGGKLPDQNWPIHEMIRHAGKTGTWKLDRAEAWATAIQSGIYSILGSSASNLYRTPFLKENPFPTDYGHAGDTAWGIQNSCKAQFAVTDSRVAEFVVHPPANLKNFPEFQFKVFGLACRTFKQALLDDSTLRMADEVVPTCAGLIRFGDSLLADFERVVDRATVEPVIGPALLELIRRGLEEMVRELKELNSLLASLRQCAHYQENLKAWRKRSKVWMLYPGAWKARSQRNRLRHALLQQPTKIEDPEILNLLELYIHA